MEQRTATTDDVEIASDRWRATVTPIGAILRQLSHDDEEVVDGFGPGAERTGARGQVLAPWVNRLRDGRYDFGGQAYRLDITDGSTGTALHGLVTEVTWDVVRREIASVRLEHRLAGAQGYPWELMLGVTYELGDDGLTVTHDVANLSASQAPYAVGAHPYLCVGAGPVDDWTVTLDASEVMLIDAERMLPTGIADVAGTPFDFRTPRVVGATELNNAYSGLRPDAQGRVGVTVTGPDGRSLVLWADAACRWIQLYTGDADPDEPRRSLAVEPMSAPADAFNSGQDLVVLGAAGRPDSTHRLRWGIRRRSER